MAITGKKYEFKLIKELLLKEYIQAKRSTVGSSGSLGKPGKTELQKVGENTKVQQEKQRMV